MSERIDAVLHTSESKWFTLEGDDHEREPISDGLHWHEGVLDCSKGPSWLGEWNDLREQFVQNRGWKPGCPEGQDRYDNDNATVHSIAVHNKEVVAGMRLTPVGSAEESLTIEMLKHNPSMQSEARQELETTPGIYYDLTRLVSIETNSDRNTKKAVIEGIGQMLGASFGLALQSHTANELDQIIWMYAVDEHFLDVLSAMGIQHRKIASGTVSSDDRYNTVVCVTHPAGAYEHLCEIAKLERLEKPGMRSMTLKNVFRGMKLTGIDPEKV